MLLAHLTDIHVAAESDYPPGDPWRAKARKHSEEVLQRVLDDVAAHEPDHVVLTGDITLTSEEAQFQRARAHLDAHLPGVPISVIPGNHDRWTHQAVSGRFFEAAFGDLMRCELGSAGFPYCHLDGKVAFLALDSSPHVPDAEPAAVLGRVDGSQLARLEELAADRRLADHFLVVMLHHHLRLSAEDARLDDPKDPTPLSNGPEVEEALAAIGANLVLHGHRHKQMRLDLELAGRTVPVLCPGSSTRVHPDPSRSARYGLYRIEDGVLGEARVRALDPLTDTFGSS